MKFANKKRGLLKYSIIIRNNVTKKCKSVRFDDEKIKSETELLNLIKKLLGDLK